jgi:hypothetical protein
MPWMMIVLILFVFFVVWVISFLAKVTQPEDPRVARPPGSATRTGSDIDRFLQEIDRLRKRNQEGGEPVRRPAAPPVVTAPPRPRPVPPVVRPVRPVPPPRPQRPAAPQVVRTLPPVPTIAPLEDYVAPMLPPIPPPPAAQSLQIVTPGPALAPLLELLRSQQGKATAVVLQTVLGPPKARRRR